MAKIIDYKLWLKKYFDLYKASIFNNNILDDLIKIKSLWETAQSNGNKVIFAGNGGSAAMASHCSVDLTKSAGIRAINFNEADLITCLGNDYGYGKWVEKAVEFYADKGDVLVLISSSGRSPNMINAAEKAKQIDNEVITFSGFDADNPLRSLGNINLWVDSHIYNVVEMTHHIWLVMIVDMIAESNTKD